MNRRMRMALIGVALVAIIALAWFFLLSPIREDIAATSTAIEDSRNDLAVAQAKLAQAEATREEGKKNQSRLIELAKMVPAEQEIPSLLVQIQDLASQAGIEFMAITPATPVETGEFRMIPLAVEFAGTFFDISDFIYRAEQMVAGPGRLLAIKQLGLQLGDATSSGAGGAGVSPELKATMIIYAFDTAVAELPVAPPAAEPASDSDESSSTNSNGS